MQREHDHERKNQKQENKTWLHSYNTRVLPLRKRLQSPLTASARWRQYGL